MTGKSNLSRLFVELSRSILDAEEKTLITGEFSDITLNDIHVIDAIGDSEAASSSVIAGKLGVTMGTLTKAVDALVRKQYVQRKRSDRDKRKVLLSLLEKGKQLYSLHGQFHEKMMEAALSQLEPEETKQLTKSLSSLQSYFSAVKV